MSGIYDDLVIPYVGPGFCCAVSCQFFAYEPFHKPIEGCKGNENFQKLKQLIESLIQSLLFIILWTSPQLKSGNATSRIAQFIGRNHFIVKEIKDVFNIPISVHISTYLSNQNQSNRNV